MTGLTGGAPPENARGQQAGRLHRQSRGPSPSGRLRTGGLWRACAVGLWVLALALAAGGLGLARLVLDRGVTYGDAGAAVLRDASIRAVNVQLEMEPDEASVARTLDMVRDAGFGWIRQQVSWADVGTHRCRGEVGIGTGDPGDRADRAAARLGPPTRVVQIAPANKRA